MKSNGNSRPIGNWISAKFSVYSYCICNQLWHTTITIVLECLPALHGAIQNNGHPVKNRCQQLMAPVVCAHVGSSMTKQFITGLLCDAP